MSDTLQIPYYERGRLTLAKMHERYSTTRAIVIYENDSRIIQSGQPDLYFHPSMAYVRMKRILRGETDRLLQVSGVQEGDSILDCTAGLCSDSLLFAHAIGESGKIVALESNALLAAIVQDGLACYAGEINEVNHAAKRIEIKHFDHFEYLKQAETNSVDIIYFDPMFQSPLESSASIQPLRAFANEQPITVAVIQEACRVARKCVVMKNNNRKAAFEHLGFNEVLLGGSNVAYGVIRI
jgi:16S rRNA G966 N2-methylase RsmD